MSISGAYEAFCVASLCVLAVMVVACFIRAVKGPSIADRIVAINMIGTQIIIMIAVVALMIGEGYLTDVAMLYAMISFLAVVVLCKVYMGVYLERAARAQQKEEHHA
jgi:multicomponent Na+:H+ antiporter subunit F